MTSVKYGKRYDNLICCKINLVTYMKSNLKIVFILVLISNINTAQVINDDVHEIINSTNIDTLISFVRDLSGEDSVSIDGVQYLIDQRFSSPSHEIAAQYLHQKMTLYGLHTEYQDYIYGRNVLGKQYGIIDTNKNIIICAHYDSETYYCADDDASGCAAVLESARLLSNYQSNYNIIYAFWDDEESGLQGSKHYANQARQNNKNIIGVLNLEMFGWDSDNYNLIDIHTDNIANSVYLASLLDSINTIYEIGLLTKIYNPGATADQASFWANNYSAVVFSEAYWGGDFNPYYHTDEDRIDKFNFEYF